MSYIEVDLKINAELEEVISQMCFDTFETCEGIVLAEEAYKDLEMISTTEGTLKIFLRDVSAKDVREKIGEIRETLLQNGISDEEIGSFEFQIIDVENQDWSKKWKEKWDVTHVSDKIVIVPSWLEYTKKPNEIIISLDPGCAFGTGTHATTQLCMKAIEKYMNQEDSVADIGMGTGILAICAKKLGAKKVYGCDNDETVIDVARENAFKNGLTEECGFFADKDFELNTADKINEKFDLICANILHNVLAEIMGDLKKLLKSNAHIILSGILNEKKQVVTDAIERENMQLVEEIHQDQWVALIAKRRG